MCISPRFAARSIASGILSGVLQGVPAAAIAAPPAFTIEPLLLPNGSSEPEIAIGGDGTTAMVSLQWLFDPANFGTDLWSGLFGVAPVFQGVVDNTLQHPGKTAFGAGDADIDIGSTGRVHITTLIFLQKPVKGAQLGVSAITCPSPAAGNLTASSCTAQIIDTTESDRPWVTSEGRHVYISCHD